MLTERDSFRSEPFIVALFSRDGRFAGFGTGDRALLSITLSAALGSLMGVDPSPQAESN
jgi:hypothetical protein